MDKFITNKIGYKGEEIYSAAVYYYGTMQDLQNTYTIVFKMDEDIDPIALRKALDMCQIRYPYLMVKIKKTLSKYSLEYNEKPIVIKNSEKPLSLSSSESNDHFLGINYYGNTLNFCAFHGLIDGNGAFNFLRTLMYYYISDRYGETPSADGVKLVADEIDPEEYTDPYLDFIPDKNAQPLVMKKEKAPTFRIAEKDKRVHLSGPHYFFVKVPQKDFIKYCRANDASPATLFNILIARAVKKLNPDTSDSIDGGLANDLRPALGKLKSHYSSVGTLTLSYDEKIQKMDIEMQNTAFRGKTILANDIDNVKAGLAGSKKFFDIVKKIPLAAIKKTLLQKIIKMNLGLQTFMVSYVGKANLGDAEKHIQGIYSNPDSPGTNIMLEVNAVNENFYLSFVQEWKEKSYFEAFCNEMNNIGLNYELVEEGDLYIPKAEL